MAEARKLTLQHKLGHRDAELWMKIRDDVAAQKRREDFIQSMLKQAVPAGPYPFKMPGVGWVQVHIRQGKTGEGMPYFVKKLRWSLDIKFNGNAVTTQIRQERWDPAKQKMDLDTGHSWTKRLPSNFVLTLLFCCARPRIVLCPGNYATHVVL